MSEAEKNSIVERLTAQAAVPTDRYIHDVLQSIIDAGASRIGVRSDEPLRCSLSTPLARMIDHTALKPDTTEEDIHTLCREARTHGFASVCVNPGYVSLARSLLQQSTVAIGTVIGFPLGATLSRVKAFEAESALQEGASELDMVLHVGLLKSTRYTAVEEDIHAVVTAAQSVNQKTIVKVILETGLLTDEEKVIACILAQHAGAHFVKTSTGFSRGGATTQDVALMHRAVGQHLGIKASGGVRTRKEAEAMIAYGATRIGASASVAIIS